MKVAIFREQRMNDNKFTSKDVYPDLSPFRYLRETLGHENCISYNLLDDRKDKDEFIILCRLDLHPRNFSKYKYLIRNNSHNKKYLITLEPFVVNPFQYFKPFHRFFDRVFTRNDELVNHKKYHKLIWPQSNFGCDIKAIDFKQKKDIILINANKWSPLPKELYSARDQIIRYFESQSTISFDLFGRGWNTPNRKQKILGYKAYSSYQGEIGTFEKIEKMSQYKFSVCFENMSDQKGYMTEKIRDSFKAKCVPIYRGADNITEYVPENCFIDYRKFNNNDELVKYLSTIDEKVYNEYITNGEKFMTTNAATLWFDQQRANNFIQSL